MLHIWFTVHLSCNYAGLVLITVKCHTWEWYARTTNCIRLKKTNCHVIYHWHYIARLLRRYISARLCKELWIFLRFSALSFSFPSEEREYTERENWWISPGNEYWSDQWQIWRQISSYWILELLWSIRTNLAKIMPGLKQTPPVKHVCKLLLYNQKCEGDGYMLVNIYQPALN